MSDLLELAERCEQGHADYQRTLLSDAAYAVFGDEADHRDDPGFWPKAIDFTAKLRAEAYLDAALTLVPDGYAWTVTSFVSRGPRAEVYDSNAVGGDSDAATPALALAAAALKARASQGQDHE